MSAIQFIYNMYIWFFYSLLLHRHLVPKKGDAGFIVIYASCILLTIATNLIRPDVLLRFLIFLIPIIVLSKFFYSEQIQWRVTVICLGTLMIILPEAILDVILFYSMDLDPVFVLDNNSHIRWILFILIAISYFLIDRVLGKLYRIEVKEVNKFMLLVILSVLVFAYIPSTYILGKVSTIYFTLFFILGFPLDYLLISYMVKYTESKEVENVQSAMGFDFKKEENVELYELRHDIANYMNALKIMEVRKKKEEGEVR